MTQLNLIEKAESLPVAWKSTVVGRAGGSQIKVLRMDGFSYPSEVHSFSEGLLVLDGEMQLEVDGIICRVGAGEIFVVPAGKPHAVAQGSRGTLVIIDPPGEA